MRRFVMTCGVLLSLIGSVAAQPFRFEFQVGDQFRFYGSSTQRISINEVFQQENLLSYRIAFSVAESDGQGRGRLKGHITYLTQGSGAGAIQQEYDTDYWVDANGRYTVPANQVMPVVRSVPTFPDRALQPGDTWTAPGEEVHDLNDNYGIDQLLRIPFDVTYTYEGPVVRNGATLQAIRSNYTLYKRTGLRLPGKKLYPLLLTGYSRQIHYFNAEKGRQEGYEEEYDLVVTLNNGDRYEFSGQGESYLVEAKVMDKPAVLEDIKRGLEARGLGQVEVKTVPLGVSLTLDNIRFPAESSVLVASEQEKVRLIGEILRQYPDRDILVEGHTADAAGGTDPQALSEARAAAVGDALVALGVRRPDQIVYRGWGASRPVAPNNTEQNRMKNRRVEITILEN